MIAIVLLVPVLFLAGIYFGGKYDKLPESLSGVYQKLFGCGGVFAYTSDTCEKPADAPSAAADPYATRGACLAAGDLWCTVDDKCTATLSTDESCILKTGLVAINYNGTILIWPRAKSSPGTNNTVPLKWNDAMSYCNNLDWLGFTDWYLPNKDELVYLYQHRDILSGYGSDYYWSSTEYGSDYAYLVNFGNGYVNRLLKSRNTYVRCVRKHSN
ncbi:MAG: hypothetical protein DRH33_00955 [Candidatus Nealsonbacteria bacterium]|nr:MAG: hypothetical protein DRH33_00955 [Candidatus Nealsonbacteria bacterium]